MNAIAIIYVNEHLDDLQAERRGSASAVAGRQAQPAHPHRSPLASSRDRSRLDELDARASRSSRLSLPGLISLSPASLPPYTNDLRPPAEVVVCPASGQVGRRVDVAERVASGSSGRQVASAMTPRRQWPRQRAEPALAVVQQSPRPRRARVPAERRSAAGAGDPRTRGDRVGAGVEAAATSDVEHGGDEAGHVAADDEHESAPSPPRARSAAPASGPSNAPGSWTDADAGAERPAVVAGARRRRRSRSRRAGRRRSRGRAAAGRRSARPACRARTGSTGRRRGRSPRPTGGSRPAHGRRPAAPAARARGRPASGAGWPAGPGPRGSP